jgi:gliding motility-associated-like protein
MPNASIAQACAGINGNTLSPVACNWNGTCNGNTGMAPAGQLPPNGSPSSYQTPLNVIAGQSYLLCLSNYSGTSQNVNLNFFGTAGVACGVSAVDQTICLGNSANVTIATPGLTAPQFTWLVTNGVSNTSGGTNVTVTPTVTTTYQVQVYQPATATTSVFQDTAIFTITVVPPPVPNAGVDDTVCLGQPIYLNGTISSALNTPSWQYLTTGITPTPTVVFAPNFNSLTPTVTVNQVGLYQFILRENNTICGMVRDTVRVLVSNITQTTSVTHPSCDGFSDGEILINSPLADEYSFNNGVTWQVDYFAVGFAAGTYTVCSRNADGCQVCTSVTLTDPPLVTVSVSNDTLICQNGTAVLSATATGGTTYNFHWAHTSNLNAVQSVNPIGDSTYYVYSENENGCISTTDSIIVTVRSALTGTITPDVIICPGYPTTLTADAIGGIGAPYTFNWNSGENGSGSMHTIVAGPAVTTLYTVTITDACESTPLVLTTNVIVAPLPVPMIAVDNDKECEPATFILTNETDPTMVDLVYWEISDGQIFMNADTINTSEFWSGLYDVQLVITSPQGCVDSTTFYNYLTVHAKPDANFNASPNPATIFNTEVMLANYTTNATYYQWYIESGYPSFSELEHLKTSFPEGVAGQYDVMLIATSEFGCIDTAEQIIHVIPEIIFYAPNAFTPDNDEYNQSWGIFIEGIDIYDFELLIFNRWGEIIWESHDPSAKWDGTYGGKFVQIGTYTWVVRTKDVINDGKYEFNGFVNILK